MSERKTCPVCYEGKEQSIYCVEKKLSSNQLIELEKEFAAHNYFPIEVVFEKAQGIHVWDPEGKHYFDFLSAYSAVNQGHSHPRIVDALVQQASKMALSSRAFYNSVFPRFAKYVTEYFGYEMVLPMNTGAEAVETAMKLARKWGYIKKNIEPDQAVIICCEGLFHGRTIAIVSMSDDPSQTNGFGPFLPGLVRIPYNEPSALKKAIEQYGNRVCAFLVEPIQGEAGVNVPDEGYLAECHKICKQNNIILIADEIQTGLGRTGKLLCQEWDGVKADIVVLGKAISGGLLPLSCVLSSKEIMLVIKPGEHGSTYGGNPLASAVGIAALEVLKQEKLTERAQFLGERLRNGLRKINCPYITLIRGRGLLNAIVLDPNWEKTATEACLLLKERGLLAKYTHGNIIRLAPPLIITEEELDECIEIIKRTFEDLVTMKKEDLPTFAHVLH
jgi:ornithine--oxo-acid transaminase